MQNQRDSHKDIKDLFSDPRIPQQIDVTKSVMDNIQSQKERFFVKYKVSILVAIALIASITTGYAAAQYYQLKNPQGEVLYQEKDVSEYEGKEKIVNELDPETQALYDIRWKIEDNMEPGTAAAVYIVAHNPKKQIFTMSRPFEFTSLVDVRKKVGEQIFVPETLPGGYSFLDASLENSFKQEYNAEALYKQAEQEKKEYVMQPLEWTNELDTLYLTYKEAGGGYMHLHISNFENVVNSTRYIVGLDNQKKEVMKIGQIEVLYTEEVRGDQVRRQIVWVTENTGKKVQYELEASGDVLNKENISQFIDAVMTKK